MSTYEEVETTPSDFLTLVGTTDALVIEGNRGALFVSGSAVAYRFRAETDWQVLHGIVDDVTPDTAKHISPSDIRESLLDTVHSISVTRGAAILVPNEDPSAELSILAGTDPAAPTWLHCDEGIAEVLTALERVAAH